MLTIWALLLIITPFLPAVITPLLINRPLLSQYVMLLMMPLSLKTLHDSRSRVYSTKHYDKPLIPTRKGPKAYKNPNDRFTTSISSSTMMNLVGLTKLPSYNRQASTYVITVVDHLTASIVLPCLIFILLMSFVNCMKSRTASTFFHICLKTTVVFSLVLRWQSNVLLIKKTVLEKKN